MLIILCRGDSDTLLRVVPVPSLVPPIGQLGIFTCSCIGISLYGRGGSNETIDPPNLMLQCKQHPQVLLRHPIA